MTEYDKSISARTKLAGALEVALVTSGFTATGEPGEICYKRSHSAEKNVEILVYTSIPQGSSMVRAEDKDAIRIIAVYCKEDGTKQPLFKESRVYRRGVIEEIVERTIQRARDAWSGVNKILRCGKCGAPTFTSKKGNQVCVRICWDQKSK